MKLSNLIEESKVIGREIVESITEESVQLGTKESYVASYLSLCLQHHQSIILLIEKSLPSSAFALIRPMYDALYRGTWIGLCSDEEDLSKLINNKDIFKYKKTQDIAKQIDIVIEGDTFHSVYFKDSIFLHDMTHGGLEQIRSQFSDNFKIIEPSFDTKSKELLLKRANKNISMMLYSYAFIIGDKKLQSIGKNLIKK